MSRTIAALALTAALAPSTRADTPAPPEVDRVAWLKANAAPLRSIDPADEDFSDLEPVRRAIGDSKIVQLGEQTHGDGATFHAKIRLIKFLHQKCGFDVLAFESGLYDCRQAWEALRAGKLPAREAFGTGVFGIWTQSRQVQPLIEYVAARAKGPHPLELCGFDCQFTAPATKTTLGRDLAAALAKLPAEAIPADTRATAVRHVEAMAAATKEFADTAGRTALVTCRDTLAKSDIADLAFWRQYVDSLVAMDEALGFMKPGDVAQQRKYGNVRDVQMAKNLVWLGQTAYPGRKIIVWAATFHVMRNQAAVEAVPQGVGALFAQGKGTPIYTSTITMGHEAWKVLGREMYTVAFTAGDGEWKLPWWDKPRTLAKPRPGSLDDLFVKAGHDAAFLDLRAKRPGGEWLNQRLIARPLGHGEMEADWTQVVDAFVFTRTMFGSDRVPREKP